MTNDELENLQAILLDISAQIREMGGLHKDHWFEEISDAILDIRKQTELQKEFKKRMRENGKVVVKYQT